MHFVFSYHHPSRHIITVLYVIVNIIEQNIAQSIPSTSLLPPKNDTTTCYEKCEHR